MTWVLRMEDRMVGQGPIHLLLVADPRCVVGCAVTLRSIVDNTHPASRLHLHLFLTPGVSARDRERLVCTVEAFGPQASLTLGTFHPRRFGHLARSKLITHTAYASCALEELLPPEVTRCIYLDCDLVVKRDIAELWATDLQGRTVGAVVNGSFEEGRRYQQRLGLRTADYFNSGVLLVDLERWRRLEVGPRAIAAAERVGADLILHDQDALNCALDEDWLPLDPSWNVWVILPELQAHHRVVFHYAGAPKPWHADYDRPFPEHFLHYLDRTAWRGWRPWNPGGLGARWTRMRRRLPSIPGLVRVVRRRFDSGVD